VAAAERRGRAKGKAAADDQSKTKDKAQDGKSQTAADVRLLKTSAEFVAGFVPPAYLIDGLLQRRYIYALTGLTGSGKTAMLVRLMAHVGAGLALAGREVDNGRGLYFACVNTEDVPEHWI